MGPAELVEQLRAQLKQERAAAAAEVAALKAQLAKQYAESEEGREEADRALAERLAAEREKRIEHLKQMAMRRMGQQGLAKGWNAWFEQWSEAVAQRRMLANAGARLRLPALAMTFHEWRDDWREETAATAAREREQALTSKGGLEVEVKKLREKLEKDAKAAVRRATRTSPPPRLASPHRATLLSSGRVAPFPYTAGV